MSNIPYYVPVYHIPVEARALRIRSLTEEIDTGGDGTPYWVVAFYDRPKDGDWTLTLGSIPAGCQPNCEGDYLLIEEEKACVIPKETFEAVFVKKQPYQFGSKQYLEEKLNELNQQLEDLRSNHVRPAEQTPCTRESFDFDMVEVGLSRAVLALENLIQTAQLDPSLDGSPQRCVAGHP